jgi:hypothetical protein
MVFNATFSDIVAVSYIGGGSREDPEKTTDLSREGSITMIKV